MGGMSRWLDVEVGADDIDINTLPSNIALVDLQNDNEFKLVIGDLGKGQEGPKLKVSRPFHSERRVTQQWYLI